MTAVISALPDRYSSAEKHEDVYAKVCTWLGAQALQSEAEYIHLRMEATLLAAGFQPHKAPVSNVVPKARAYTLRVENSSQWRHPDCDWPFVLTTALQADYGGNAAGLLALHTDAHDLDDGPLPRQGILGHARPKRADWLEDSISPGPFESIEAWQAYVVKSVGALTQETLTSHVGHFMAELERGLTP